MAETKTNIYARLCKAQSEIPSISKDKKAQAFGKGGSYAYTDISSILSVVMPILNRNGLSLIQRTTGTENTVSVETVIFSNEGESISSGEFTVSTIGLMQKGVQAHGSAVTYARRYSLAAFLGLAYGDDDDGRAATAPHYEKRTTAQQAEPSANYLEMKKLISSAMSMTELNNLAQAMKLKTGICPSEMNSLRALWASKKDELTE